MRDYEAEEWFSFIRRLCSKYGLPTPSELMKNPPTKVQWKTTYDRQLKEYWVNYVSTQAVYLQKARFLNPLVYCIGKPHPVIRHASNHVRDVQKCTVKLQVLTGSYILQAHRAKFNQFEVKPECLLCGEEPETRTHFLVTCKSLQEQRLEPLSQIQDILEQSAQPEVAKEICSDAVFCTALLLDCTSKTITEKVLLTKVHIAEIEQISQRLIFSLHVTRKSMLTLLAPGLRKKRGKTNVNAISLQPARRGTTDSHTTHQFRTSHQ